VTINLGRKLAENAIRRDAIKQEFLGRYQQASIASKELSKQLTMKTVQSKTLLFR
jgi:hypothetical protein